MITKIKRCVREIRKEDFFPSYNVRLKEVYYKVTYSIISQDLTRTNLVYRFKLFNDRLDDNRVKGDIAQKWNVESSAIIIIKIEKNR